MYRLYGGIFPLRRRLAAEHTKVVWENPEGNIRFVMWKTPAFFRIFGGKLGGKCEKSIFFRRYREVKNPVRLTRGDNCGLNDLVRDVKKDFAQSVDRMSRKRYNDKRNLQREGRRVNSFLHRTWAEVNLDRLRDNLAAIRGVLSPGCRIMGIVKADAYGHGAVEVARELQQDGADWFGVSNLEEAIQLRQAGIERPILVISHTPPEEAAQLAQHRVTQTVLSSEYGQALSREAQRLGLSLPIHIKVDTGMSRVGFFCHETAEIPATAEKIVAVCRLPGLQPEGIFTHFASADEEDDGGFTEKQFALFTGVIDAARQQGIEFSLRHCCNSAATLRFPHMHLDMVRPGIILYGLMPDRWMAARWGAALRPVMALKTAVTQVKEVPAGTTLSYNRTYTAPAPIRVATVPIGYGDGYCRSLSNKGQMQIDGQLVPVIGRVCMDQCMLDVTALPGVQVGTEVTVFGGDTLTADMVAAWMGTINYEVICLLSKRIPRLYYRRGQLVGKLNYILMRE